MGSPPRVAIREPQSRLEAGDVIISSTATVETTCAGPVTKTIMSATLAPILLDVHLPPQQPLSWYLEASAPPTPLLTTDSSGNSSLTSFLFSENASPVVETFDYNNFNFLASPSALPMADAEDKSPTFPTETPPTGSVNSLALSAIVFPTDKDDFTSLLKSPIFSSEISEPAVRDYDLEQGLFGDAIGIPIPRVEERQSTVDSPLSTSFSSKFSHFPALKKWKQKKDAAAAYITTQLNSPETRPVSKMRSQSFTSGINNMQSLANFPSMSVFSSPEKPAIPAEIGPPVSPLDLNRFMFDSTPEPIERTRFTSTPLLPPSMSEFGAEDDMDSKIHTPFLSSAVGSSRALSVASSNSETSCPFPAFDHYSSAGSIFERPMHSSSSRRDTQQSASDFLPSPADASTMPVKKQDEWSSKLGHFNFTIDPEPYLPEDHTAAAYEKLLADWEAARAEYCKHQARTLEHYGPNSKAFKLTEEKWSFIDGQWRKNEQDVRSKALASGEKLPEPNKHGSEECAESDKAMVLPSVSIPHLDGKFPKLGDSDIIGPMAVDPPRERAVSPTRMGLSSGTGWKLARFFGRMA
jgi:hypothetical protein